MKVTGQQTQEFFILPTGTSELEKKNPDKHYVKVMNCECPYTRAAPQIDQYTEIMSPTKPGEKMYRVIADPKEHGVNLGNAMFTLLECDKADAEYFIKNASRIANERAKPSGAVQLRTGEVVKDTTARGRATTESIKEAAKHEAWKDIAEMKKDGLIPTTAYNGDSENA